MAIVTITSDLGNGSFELAALKGAILCHSKHVDQIIDISNEIEPFNIVEGAFILSNASPYFPPGSIHIVCINPFYAPNYQLVVVSFKNQIFIAPNNGFIPLLSDSESYTQVLNSKDFNDSKSLYQSIGTLIKQLIKPESEHLIDQEKTEIYQRITLKPVLSKDTIRGTIIYIDTFGNLISNIKKEQFEKIRAGRSFAVYFRHKDPITSIQTHYHQVPVGEELCIFNMANYLEIAINLGNAHKTIGLEKDDIIQIDFFE